MMVRPNPLLLIVVLALLANSAVAQRLPRWRQVPDLTARYGAATGYDEARGRIVMFGGSPIISGPGMSFNDTCEWDGSRWLPRQPRTVPQPRHGASMSYDPIRRTVIMFGGVNNDIVSALDETWEWDGEDWHQLQPAHSPPPLLSPSMATDPVRRRIVLFAGKTQVAHPGPWLCLDDTGEWDGADWTLMQPSHRPSSRDGAGLAYCARTSTLVMYGGSTTGGGAVGDRLTWEWDGIDWRYKTAYPTDPPSGAKAAPAMVSLPWSDHVLMFAESSTWEWDGSTWSFVQGTGGPGQMPEVYSPAYAADNARQKVVCFSGFRSTTAGVPRMTWTFDQSGTWSQAYNSFNLWKPFQSVQYDPARDEYLCLQQDERGLARWMRTFRMRGAALESEMEEHAGVTAVPLRSYGGICFDPVSQKMLFFGGKQSGYLKNDTWLWDGTDWTNPNYAVNPPPGRGAPVYDSRRRSIVMPLVLAGQQFETWEWTDARGWRQLQTATVPPRALNSPKAAYDPINDQIITIIQHYVPNSMSEYRTWVFDGNDWHPEIGTPQLPRFVNGVINVPELGGVVAFLINDDYRNDPYRVWLWSGSDWRRIQTANAPGGERVPSFPGGQYPPRVFHGLPVYDSSRGKVRLFVGRGPGWFCEDLIVDRLSASSHGPSIGTTWTAYFDDPSQAGHAFAIALSGNDWPAIPVRFRPELGVFERIPLGDDPLFQASAAAGLGIGLLDPQGRGSLSLPLPNHQALVGYRFHAAALTIDPAIPALGVISNPVTVEIQR